MVGWARRRPWAVAAVVVAACAGALLERRRFQTGWAEPERPPAWADWAAGVLLNPYLLVFLLLPVGAVLVVRENVRVGSPEVALRAGGLRRCAALVRRRLAVGVGVAACLVTVATLLAGQGLSVAGPRPVSLPWPTLPLPPLAEIALATVVVCVGVWCILAAVATATVGLGQSAITWSMLAVWTATLLGFKGTTVPAALTPAGAITFADGSFAARPVSAVALLALGRGILWWRQHGSAGASWLNWLFVPALLLACLARPRPAGTGQALGVIWQGLGHDRTPVRSYVLLMLLGIGPVVAWLGTLEGRLTGCLPQELLRMGSLRGWLLRELLTGAGRLAAWWGLTVAASLVAAWVLSAGRSAPWAFPFPPAWGIGWLLLIGLLGQWFLLVCLLIARLAGGSTAAIVTLGAVVALGFVAGARGFPVGQHSWGLLGPGGALAPGPRAALLLGFLGAAVMTALVAAPPLLHRPLSAQGEVS